MRLFPLIDGRIDSKDAILIPPFDFTFSTPRDLSYDGTLKPKNVVVIYRENDADSLEFAQYYQAIHSLDNDQLIPVPCSGDEILADYDAFYDQIEAPVLDYLLANDDEYFTGDGKREVVCLIVGYGVPGGFIDGSDTIATASRLARIFHPFNKKTSNPLYNRVKYKAYDLLDANQVFITSRFDLPTLEQAKSLLDRSKFLLRQQLLNGSFFFDNITVPVNSEETNYQSEMTDFESLTLPGLNMVTNKTVNWDSVTDVPLFRLISDSVTWCWKSSRAGYSYFEPSKAVRFFCYNADPDGAGAMRDREDRRFPMLALSSGYTNSAGAMSDPSADGYLRPRPFFESLLRGTTVGEAFLYAVPYVDWTVTLFGDPLIRVKFPTGTVLPTGISELQGFEDMGDHLANSIAYTIHRRDKLQSIYDIINSYTDLTVVGDLSTKALSLRGAAGANVPGQFGPSASTYLQFPQTVSGVDSYLSANDIKLSVLIPRSASVTLSNDNLYTTGTWFFTTTMIRPDAGFFFYHFQLECSYDADFASIFLSADSRLNQTDWQYEKDQDSFVAFPAGGVGSNYAGRRIKYNAELTLPRATVFYIRVRQVNNFFEVTDWQTSTKVINT